MAKNLSREYAEMSEDERRAFELKRAEGETEAEPELDLDDPRRYPPTEPEGKAPPAEKKRRR